MIVKINRIIVRDAGLKVKQSKVETLRKQVAALFDSAPSNILFIYDETPDKKVDSSSKQLNINNKKVF